MQIKVFDFIFKHVVFTSLCKRVYHPHSYYLFYLDLHDFNSHFSFTEYTGWLTDQTFDY